MSIEQDDLTAQYMPQVVPAQKSTTTEAMVSRQAQEVQMAMYVAKKFPRDTYEAFNRIMQACERPVLAENAMYEYPRGNQKVTGPSIRLAEVLAQNWGNIDFGILELEQKHGESQVMAYAWDLETNTRQTKVFTVKHERKASGSIKKLDDPRDIYELVANQGSRRVRACILGVIPGDIVDAAVEKCKKTMVNGHTEPFEDRIRKMIVAFDKDYKVKKEQLEEYIGCNVDAFTENDYVRLKNVFKALRDGMAKREDYFDIRVGKEIKSSAEEQFKNKKEAGAKNAQADQSELPLAGSKPGVHEQ